MICDGITGIDRYRGLSRGLDVLIDWLATHDVSELALGRTEIMGDKVFANTMEATTRRVADAAFEVHRHYMDVQVDIDGAERFMVTPGEMVEEGPFDEASDGGLCQPAPGNTDLIEGELGHGRFVIFMVGEPHMPTLALPEEGPRPVRKVCFKVLDDAHWDA